MTMLGGEVAAMSPNAPAPAPGAPLRSGAALTSAIQFFMAAQCLIDEPWPKQASIKNRTCFDFIVVGGGTGGSLLAARLAEEPRFRVLLVEAGPDPPKEAIIPGMYGTLMSGPYDWRLVSQPLADGGQALAGGAQALPAGRMLGGSGALSATVYSRGFPADYDEWARALGDDDWAWERVLPYFKKTERVTDERILADPALAALHGRAGPVEVSGRRAAPAAARALLRAINETGVPLVQDMTDPRRVGAGRHSHTIARGRRASAVTALLNDAAKRPNLFVMKNALVTKVLIEELTAYGVKVYHGGEELHLYARKEVIVSAGAFHTPRLLMLSGVGPAEHLREMGVAVVRDLPVGDNLGDHVMVPHFIAADGGTCPAREGAAHLALLRYLHDGSGPLAGVESVSAQVALRNSTRRNVPDLALYPTCLPVGARFYEGCVRVLRLRRDICLQLQGVLNERELVSVSVALLSPASRGRVRLRSPDPASPPLVFPGTFSAPADLAAFPEAAELVAAIARSSHFRTKNAEVLDIEVDACKGLLGSERVRCWARAAGTSAWHAAGTAAMGAVLDTRLRVRGVRDLRVVDASAMPTVPRGHTNAPVLMIAEKAADYIKEQYSTCPSA